MTDPKKTQQEGFNQKGSARGSAESAKGGDGTLQGSNAPSVIAGRVNSKKKVTKTKNKKAVAPVPNPAASILIQKQQQDEEEDLPDI